MRILHTSDWHLGKTLEGRSRFGEQERFIDELCAIVADEKVDLVLIAGDIFDSVNPPAAAEELYYDALDRLAAGGKRAVIVISGNHDSPERLCAASPLAGRYGITLFGLPKDIIVPSLNILSDKVSRIEAGQGWVKLAIPGCAEQAILALLPYPSESRLNEIFTASLDNENHGRAYTKRIQELFGVFASNFRKDTVNLGASHIFVRGGEESDSERPIQLGGALTVDLEALPQGAHYIALGHLHKPQEVKATSMLTRYSGSPIAYSFSEIGYAKSVTLVEAFPGQKAVAKEIYINAGYPLARWRAKEGLAQVFKWIDEGKDANAWLDIEINLSAPLTQQDIYNLKHARERIVNIRPIFTDMEQITEEARAKLPIDELFRRFFRKQNGGAEPDGQLIELFLRLLDTQHSEDANGEVDA